MELVTAGRMRELDRRAIEEAGVPSLTLMERAAEGIAEAALSLMERRPGKSRAAVFCGTGNNGGDGIAAGRILAEKGVSVRLFLVGDRAKMTAEAGAEAARLSERDLELEAFDPEDRGQRSWARGSDVVLDALFGVGLSREVEGPWAAAVDLIGTCKGKVVSADVPSGIDADTGRILGRAVRADRTVTFTYAKIGHAVGDGELCSGDVEIRDIMPELRDRGPVSPVRTVERAFVEDALPSRRPDGHKGTFGEVLVVGGSVGYTGAPYLTAAAALRSGCGLVHLGVPEAVWAVEASKCASAMPFPLPGKPGSGHLGRRALPEILERLGRCDVLALGPGLGRERETVRLVWELLRRTERPVVLDADGINALEGHMDVLDARKGRTTILTPHEGEAARIGMDLSVGRAQAARAFAVEHGCVMVLKGHRTVTASPAGTVLVNGTGGTGLAKGGSGDVLTGVIASLLAQGATPVQAAAAGVWIHGRAGDLGERTWSARSLLPTDTVSMLPDVFLELDPPEPMEL